MKKTIKLIGIIALVAVIGFSMAACGDDDNGGGSGGGGGYAGTYTDTGDGEFQIILYAAGNWSFRTTNSTDAYMNGDRWAVSGNTILLYYSGNTVLYTLTIVDSTTLSWNGGLFRKR